MSNLWDYVEAGFKVIPIHPINPGGVCSCDRDDCDQSGKHPKMSNWQLGVEWSDEQLEVMEQITSKTGFGVICKGWLIIDIDPRNGGNEGYKQLVTDTGIDYKKDSKFVVQTGGGGWHIYYKNTNNDSFVTKINKYKGVDFKSSGFVIGCSSLHKSGALYESEHGNPCDVSAPPSKLTDILKEQRYRKEKLEISKDSINDDQIRKMLEYINPDCEYEEWRNVGMAIHDETGGAGFELWDDWSRKGEKYEKGCTDKPWHCFGKSNNPVTIAFVKKLAYENGYIESVEFEYVEEVEVDTQDHTNLLGDLSDIDLNNPPGLVGECAKYIKACPIRKRDTIAVSAALSTISSLAGQNWKDELHGFSPNLITFNIADSGTGKEAVQNAYKQLLDAAGMQGCIYGQFFKSEKEIYKNIVDHQTNVYIIDEFGDRLKGLVTNKSNAPHYMQGITTALMEIYTKTSAKLLLGGDNQKEHIDRVSKQIAGINKLEENNEMKPHHKDKRDELEKLLSELMTGGVNNPYLNLAGYAIPQDFDECMTADQVYKGFIGRSIIFEEEETAPRKRQGFKKPVLDDELEDKLRSLFLNGSSLNFNDMRVGKRGNINIIKTNPEAKKLLQEIDNMFDDLAEIEAERSGFTALWMRAFEPVAKISLILAIGTHDNTRTVDHVRWAYKLAKRDMDRKIKKVMVQSAKEENRKGDELLQSIEAFLTKDHGRSVREINRKLRKFKACDIKKGLDILIKDKVTCVKEETAKNGRKVEKYYLER